jgi:hypothetical protein
VGGDREELFNVMAAPGVVRSEGENNKDMLPLCGCALCCCGAEHVAGWLASEAGFPRVMGMDRRKSKQELLVHCEGLFWSDEDGQEEVEQELLVHCEEQHRDEIMVIRFEGFQNVETGNVRLYGPIRLKLIGDIASHFTE